MAVGAMGTASEARTSPASMRWARVMTVLPVRASPARTAAWIGAAPRHRGSRLAWRLIAVTPLRSGSESFWPKAMTTHASARPGPARARTAAVCGGALMSSGLSSGTPGRRWAAQAPTGVGAVARPRPAGRSGWVTTHTIVCPWLRRASSVGTPNWAEPR
ncbi:MAG: hypothetical protein C0475_01545 [Planctomyces sp.]|nr:hypothetical protein [Planctomyces sp.]MBA4039087.1 hypothetical protein [Planctomyces sp.]MBA4120129.1 hypothetical protein [Isosphaera sp.]